MSQINNCNFTLNGQEYYSTSVNKVDDALSLPFIASSIFVSFIFVICAIYFTYSTYKITNQFTTPTVILLILGLCCLSSFVSFIINYYKTKNDLEHPDTSNTSNLSRPCYSTQKQIMILQDTSVSPSVGLNLSSSPSPSPSPSPTPSPSPSPTPSSTPSPSPNPTYSPSPNPTYSPYPSPTYCPTPSPTYSPSPSPSPSPTYSPTYCPTPSPTYSPSPSPSPSPSSSPTYCPTPSPTYSPSPSPN